MASYQLLFCAKWVKSWRGILNLRSSSLPATLSPGKIVEAPGSVFDFHFAKYFFVGLIVWVVSFDLKGCDCTNHIISALLSLVDQQLVVLRRHEFLVLMRIGEKDCSDVGVHTPHCEDNITDIVRVISKKGPSLDVLDRLRH